jgi:hypothetical protein
MSFAGYQDFDDFLGENWGKVIVAPCMAITVGLLGFVGYHVHKKWVEERPLREAAAANIVAISDEQCPVGMGLTGADAEQIADFSTERAQNLDASDIVVCRDVRIPQGRVDTDGHLLGVMYPNGAVTVESGNSADRALSLAVDIRHHAEQGVAEPHGLFRDSYTVIVPITTCRTMGGKYPTTSCSTMMMPQTRYRYEFKSITGNAGLVGLARLNNN